MSKAENSEEINLIDHYFETARTLRRAGSLSASKSLLEDASNVCSQLAIDDPVRQARILDELGTVSFWSGKHAQAEDYYQQALSKLERAFYSAHPFLAPVLQHLAHLYIAMDRFESASAVAHRTLAIRQSTQLQTDSATIENLRMCAVIELELGHLSEAESLLRRAIDILEPSTLGPFEEFVYLLAEVYQMQGKNDDAEGCYKQALATYAQRLGRPARYAACLSDYAKFLRQLGRVRDAERLELGVPRLLEASNLEKALGVREMDRELPDTEVYQCLSYPVTIFH